MLKKRLDSVLSWFEEHYITSLIVAILVAIFIFYISSKSFENGSPGPNWEIKPYIYHFGIFFILAFFLSISLSKGKYRLLVFVGILASIAYGASDELHQLFVPNRACDINDFLTDSVGILFAGIIYLNLKVSKKKLLSQENCIAIFRALKFQKEFFGHKNSFRIFDA